MKLLSLNSLGIALVALGFFVSLARVLSVSGITSDNDATTILLAHWQLEPGYREAMDDVMASYNELPHVKAQNIRVEQSPVTEKFYAQWLNTHLVAGTAPDINERGMSKMVRGTFLAKYFEPLGNVVTEPNPYNAPEYLPGDIEPDLAEFLATAPWRETFLDGMEGGYDDALQDYYAVPTSFWGSVKMYINTKMMRAVKDVVIEAIHQQPMPDNLRSLADEGFVNLDADLDAWLSSDAAPRSLGELFLLCEGVYLYADQTGQDKIVPIAGSKYSEWMFPGVYQVPFTSRHAPPLDRDGNGSITRLEVAIGMLNGQWSFDDEYMQAYHACIRKICSYFPQGFLALERDQANNRFVLSRALMIASGAWDANSLFVGAQAHDDPEDRFEVMIAPFPLPDRDEKWGDLVSDRASEANSNAGAPYQVYQRSAHKREAIDFIQYLTSMEVNERFNKLANWLPVVIGAEPSDQMLPFAVSPEGVFPAMRVDPRHLQGNIATRYSGMVSQYLSGDVSYQDVVEAVEEAVDQRLTGIDELFYNVFLTDRDGHRNVERSIAGQDVRKLLLGSEDAESKQRNLVSSSVRQLNGLAAREAWARLFPDQPFPDRE